MNIEEFLKRDETFAFLEKTIATSTSLTGYIYGDLNLVFLGAGTYQFLNEMDNCHTIYKIKNGT